MDNEIDRKIDVSAVLFLLVQNRHQTHGWTLIGPGANRLGIQEWQETAGINEKARSLLFEGVGGGDEKAK